jgi:putative spermidine/putrescine transport system permease protein
MQGHGRCNVETLILNGMTTVLLLLIAAPIIMILILSFSASGTLEFPPPGWTLAWYRQALEFLVMETGRIHRAGEAMLTSLAIACTVMILGVVVGVPASYALVRLPFKGKFLVEQLISLPVVFPVIVLGISLLIMASNLGIELGFWRIVVGHVIITLPFIVRNCTAPLRGINPALEEAARTLGASWPRTFVEIVLPLMRPGILAGMLLVFLLSFNDFVVTYFLYTVDVFPFSIWLFQRGNTSLDPLVFSLSSVVIAIDAVLIWVLNQMVGKGQVSL